LSHFHNALFVQEVLDEIKTDFRKNNEANSQSNHDLFRGRIVVIVKDDRSLLQLRDFLSAGNNGNDVLESRLRHFVTQQAAHIRLVSLHHLYMLELI
jgi:hypothetical protein